MRTSSRGRRWLPVVAAGATAAVVGLACGALVFGHNQVPQPPTAAGGPGQPAGTAPPASPQPAASPPAATPAPGGGPGPADASFVDVAGVRLAVSPAAGPRDTGGGLARGFARTRAGAALAAAHILVRVHPEVGADVFGPTLHQQVVGDEQDVAALAGNVEDSYEQLLHQWPATYGQPAGRLQLAIPGYRVDRFTGGRAAVALLIEVPNNGGGSLLGATTLAMRWHRGDWALVAPAAGAFVDTFLVEDVSGFSFWES